jgi:hypothetical protein
MDTDKREQMHLDRLMAEDNPEEFGPSHVQRMCRIGYNYACHVLERGVKAGVLANGSKPWTYRVSQ